MTAKKKPKLTATQTRKRLAIRKPTHYLAPCCRVKVDPSIDFKHNPIKPCPQCGEYVYFIW